MKILYITNRAFNPESANCGGGVTNNRNYRLLCALGETEVAVKSLPELKPPQNRAVDLIKKAGRVFFTEIPSAFYPSEVRKLKKIISTGKWDVIFFDNSVIGGLAGAAKRHCGKAGQPISRLRYVSKCVSA